MSSEVPSSVTPPPESPQVVKNRKVLWWSIVSGLLILLLLIPVWLFSLIFAPWQEIQPTLPQMNDFFTLNKLIRKVSKEFSKKKELSERAVLQVSPDQLNSLFLIAGNVKSGKIPHPIRYYRPQCHKDGSLSAVFPIGPFKQSLLKNKAVYLQFVFRISKNAGEQRFRCTIDSAKVTKLSLPSSAREKFQEAVDKKLSEKQFESAAVESISFKNGKFVIVYSPKRIMSEIGGAEAILSLPIFQQ